MYPDLTEQEKNVVRQFMEIYERDEGYYEPLISNRTEDYENALPNAVFMINHMRSEEPGHPNYRLPQYRRVISKMSPDKVSILNRLIREMNSRHGWKTIEVDRKKKIKKSNVKRKSIRKCSCRKK
jgi:hypothetical protein